VVGSAAHRARRPGPLSDRLTFTLGQFRERWSRDQLIAIVPAAVRAPPRTTAWVASQVGHRLQLVPISAVVWRIDKDRAR
jgi:hypothetical protein